MAKMRELAKMAYRRRGWKDLTHIFATETEACVEYIARATSSTAPLAIPVCYICHFTEKGKIDRVREYRDVATMTRQFGIEGIKSKILGFFIRRTS
jgi:hypothetical protein